MHDAERWRTVVGLQADDVGPLVVVAALVKVATVVIEVAGITRRERRQSASGPAPGGSWRL